MNEQSIFAEALDQPNEAERAAYLDRACQGNAELRGRVETLLRAHQAASAFLDEPAAGAVATLDEPMRECVGMEIGPYKLLQQLGEGGMGTVFLAQQSKPVERMVALKLIKPGMDSRQVIARFEAERQALALMDHPNIARVLDAGTTESGRPYFVMELVKGMPITKYCDQQRLSPRQRLELFLPICHAIQHAHQKGIIHRDVKPSNVMVSLYDGKPVPKVIDFGVAKATGSRLTDRTLFTAIGSVVGTFEYMSPEQAELNQLDVDTRTDIYSLGVLLYELLTGTTPLDRRRLGEFALLELLRAIREDEPPKPSTRVSTDEGSASIAANRSMEPGKLSGMIRGELDWIVMKALEKDRTRRYETANGFAMDVQRYLADEAVQACPPSLAYRLRKFTRRNKVAIFTGTVVATSLVLGTAISIWQATVAWDAEGQAQQSLEAETHERKRAEQAEGSARQAAEQLARQKRQTQIDFSTALLDRGLDLCDRGERAKGMLWMARSLASAPDDAADLQRVIRLNLAAWRAHTSPQRAMGNAPGRIESLGMTGDGKTVFIACSAAKYPSTMQFPTDNEKLFEIERIAPGSVVVLDVGDEGSSLRGKVPHLGYPAALAFSRDGKWVVTATDHRTLQIWDARAMKPHGPPLVHPDTALTARFSDDGSTLLTTSGPPTQAAYQFREHAWNTEMYDGPVPNWGNTVHLWDPDTGQTIGRPIQHPGPLSVAAISPDGKLVLTASHTQARLWDAATGEARQPALRHDGLITAAAFSPDGRYVLTAGDATPAQYPAGDPAYDPNQTSVSLRISDPNRPTGIAVQWDVATGTPIGESLTPMRRPRLALFSPDGNVVLTSGGGHAELWCVAHHHYRVKWAGRRRLSSVGVDEAAAFSLDGRTVAIGSTDTFVRAFDVATGMLLCPPMPQRNAVTALAFYPNKGRILSGGEDGSFRSWSLLEPRATVTNLTSFVVENRSARAGKATTFSPDGKRILVAADAKNSSPPRVEIWDLASSAPPELSIQRTKCYVTLMGPEGKVAYLSPEEVPPTVLGRPLLLATDALAAAFSPDGQAALVSSRDGALWQWRDGRWTSIRTAPEPTLAPTAPDSGDDSANGVPEEPTPTPKPAEEANGATQAAPLEPTPTQDAPEHPDATPGGARQTPGTGSVVIVRSSAPSSDPSTEPAPSASPVADDESAPTVEQTQPVPAADTPSDSPPGSREPSRAAAGATERITHGDARSAPPDDAVVTAIAFGPEGKTVLLGCRDGGARLWSAETWQPLGQPFKHENSVSVVAVSPGGSVALSASGNSAILWDAATGKAIGQPLVHQAMIHAAVFSPDGRIVATAGGDATARLWNAATGQPQGPPLHHQGLDRNGKVGALAFSPDGTMLLTASGRWKRYWDVALGKPIGPPLVDPTGDTEAMKFVSDPPGVMTYSTEMFWSFVRRCELPPALAEGSVEQFVLSTELVTGQVLDDAGVAGWLSVEEYNRRIDRLKELDPQAWTMEPSIAWHRREADGAAKEQFWASAEWHCDQLIEREPDQWRHYVDRGRARAAQKKYLDAIADYNRAIDRGATGYEAWALRGLAYAELARWDRAADDYATASERDADWPVWCRRAEAHRKASDARGFQLACTRLLERFSQTDDPLIAFHAVDTCLAGTEAPPDADKLVRLAEVALEGAHLVKTDRCSSGFDPQEAHELLVMALYRAGRYDEVIGHLRRAIEEPARETSTSSDDGQQQTSVNWLLLLALANHRLGRGEEAQQWLEQAKTSMGTETWPAEDFLRREVLESFDVELPAAPVQQQPSGDAPAPVEPWKFHYDRGRAFATAGQPEAALQEFIRAMELGADDAQVWHLRGLMYAHLGRLEDAAADLKQAIVRADDDADMHFDLGVVLANLGRADEAIAAYREAVRLDPEEWRAHNNLGSLLLDKKEADEAVAAFRQAIQYAPQEKQALVYANLGNALRTNSDVEGAIAAYRTAIRLDRRHLPAHLGLGGVFNQLERWDDAAAAYKEAIRVDPRPASAHENLGWVLLKQQKWADSEAAYRQAVALDRQSPGPQYNLGWVLERQRKWDEAAGAYREVVRIAPNHRQVADGLHRLAIAKRDEGDAAAAEALHREALAVRLAQVGDDHVGTAMELHDLAFVLMRDPERRAEAEQLYRDALRVRRQLLGEGSVPSADTAFRLAQVLGDQRKFDEAETLLREAHEALAANRASEPARNFEPVLLQWIVEQYRKWERIDRAEEWATKLRPKEPADEANSNEKPEPDTK